MAICLLGASGKIQAQKHVELPARVVLKNGDVLDAKLKAYTVMFNKSVIDERSINKRFIEIADSSTGKFQKIKAELIKEVRFTDLKGWDRVFVGTEETKDRYPVVDELMWDGKIRWLRAFGSSEGGTVVAESYWIAEDGKVYKFKPLSNWRKLIRRAMASRPDLWPEIDAMSWSYSNLRQILQKYENE